MPSSSEPTPADPRRFLVSVATYLEPSGGCHIGGMIQFQITSKDPAHIRQVMAQTEEELIQEFRRGFIKEMQRMGILPQAQTKEVSFDMGVSLAGPSDTHQH